MKKPLLLAATAALLLGTAALGAALASPRLFEDRHAGASDHVERATTSEGERFRVADRDHRRRHESRERHREHHDDDDDDDDDRRGGDRGRDRSGRPAVTWPNDPTAGADRIDAVPPSDPNSPKDATAPVQTPGDGLFRSRTRPRVEVN